jgi:CRISPR-associated endonuclease/helicase Cas3
VNRDGTGKARVFVVAPFVELEQIADARDVAEASAAEARDKAEQALRKAKDRLAERQAKAKRAQIVAAEKAVAQAEEKLREARLEAAAALEAIAQIQLLRTHDLLAAIGNASPAALRALPPEQVEAASAAPVQTIPLHVETVQALSLTSAPVGLGIDTLLHGIDEHQIPDTYLVWRRDVPALAEAGDLAAAEALAVFPPRPAEVARVPRGVAERLVKKALARLQEDAADATLPVILRDARGQTLVLRLQQAGDLTRIRFANATLLLPPEAGGLIAQNGLPDPASKEVVTDVADDATRHRVLPGEPLPDWAEQATELRIPLTDDSDEPDAEDAEPRALIYLTRRIESGLSTEDSDITRLAATPQTLADHSARVADAAERIGRALLLEPQWIEALREAGAWHDQGKALRLWQRAAGAGAEIMAKAKYGRFRPALLGRYRHEFGSLTRAERAGCNDLVLHLIAAHHGWARPDFPDPRQWGPELPHALAAAAARAAAERFGRLQTKLGPWQLAWLEALLKCADAWVSSGRDRAHDAAHAEPPHA